MRPIVCATRGGEASRRTQQKAIELAKEQGAPLIFLYVANYTFAGSLSDILQEALLDELLRLGRALLGIAQARAEAQGLHAQATVRCCDSVPQTIEGYLKEVNASTLVIGASQTRTDSQVFEPQEVEEFAQAIGQASGVEVVLVR
jgi:nucleotide-binding universal stress UspA family protein